MEKVSIIIPVFNQIEITKDCIANIREFNKDTSLFEIIIVDNGSTDNTPLILSKDKEIVYIRNQENLGISKAYNKAEKVARYNILCFMHNDVFIYEENWISILSDFICRKHNIGIVGVYGAKTMDKEGNLLRKIHRKVYRKNTYRRPPPYVFGRVEEVAIVDGQLISLHRDIFKKIGGFNEEFIISWYDKDISMRALTNKKKNYVLAFPFEHLRATTRKNIPEVKKIMEEEHRKLVELWYNSLPVDVTNWKGKISYILKKKYLPYWIHLKRWINRHLLSNQK